MSLSLRPHHALCLQFFEGKGYSEDFVLHMYRIAQALEDDPPITLTDGCDDVCAACPHKLGSRCDHDEKVSAIDRRAREHMGLQSGDMLSWRELAALAREKVISAEKLREVCRDCQWIDICSK